MQQQFEFNDRDSEGRPGFVHFFGKATVRGAEFVAGAIAFPALGIIGSALGSVVVSHLLGVPELSNYFSDLKNAEQHMLSLPMLTAVVPSAAVGSAGIMHLRHTSMNNET